MEPDIGKNIIRATTSGGWYFVSNPERVVKTIAAQVVRDGGTILQDDVQRIERTDGKAKALHLASGLVVPLDKLVICAGAYSHQLAQQLGDKVLLEAERGYHIVLPNAGVKLSRCPHLCPHAGRRHADGDGTSSRWHRRIRRP